MKRTLAALAICALSMTTAWSQGNPVQIGVLENRSGVFSRVSGAATVVAARMAVRDFGGTVLGRPVEVIAGDHQDKPDTGLAIARRWYDEGVPLIIGLGNSSIPIGVQQLAHEKNEIDLVTTGGNRY